MSDERGFTLIEVLVALAILALGLGAVLQSVSAALAASARAQDIVSATLAAQSRLAELAVDRAVSGGRQTGERWEVEVAPAGDGLALVAVTARAGNSSVRLTTLRPLEGR